MIELQRHLVRVARAGMRRVRPDPEPEVLVVSYPKCGRTWLRVLIGKALCDLFGVDQRELLATFELSREAGLRPTRFVHDGVGGVAGIPWYEQDRDKSRFSDKRVVLMVRDPRDVMVSSYFQATKRMRAYQGSISGFIRDECYGVRTVLAMYRGWQESQQVPVEFLLVRYEDLHADPGAALRRVLAVMGVGACDDAVIESAVRHGEFGNMRVMERSGRFDRKLRPGDATDGESYKVRRGVVGGFADYLGAEDIAYVERAIVEAGDPFGFAQRRDAGSEP
ncbi:MAG: sulfotransferase domain-containing protein [Myxococcota bacterium]